ncbi:MAG: M15 family metallopeptidase [Lachnospiraceae bacterium]|nr:M15 family metallopeptidase [Lachnospiraceae bacterium]
MKKTFREKVISKFTHIAKKNKLLYYPCLALMSVVLCVYYIGRHFATNTKRYASVLFVVIFFMNSCSFSFAVFAEKTGFIKAQETYSAVVEDSDIALAELSGEENQIYIEDDYEDDYGDYDNEEYIEGVDAAYTLDDILESYGDYQTEEESDWPLEDNYVFDSSDWRLVLINKQHPIPEDYSFKLGTIKDGMMCDERIISDLLAMMQAARKDGINLVISSPYRTDYRQEYNFNARIKRYMGQGYSYMDAYKLTSQVITVPGASEHQVGLALDITCDTYSSLNEGFGDTKAGQWLAEHSCEYGFALRYPSGKEYITSIEYEPWHFRYVGREAATIMHDEDICLEEFWDRYL